MRYLIGKERKVPLDKRGTIPMSEGKHSGMATASIRPTPRAETTSTKPERPQAGHKSQPVEDLIDCTIVRKARFLAERRGEKPMAWSDFKKKLAR